MMEAEAAWATVSPPSPTQSRYLAIFTILGFAIPIAFYLWFLGHYSLNVVWLDQWNDVSLIRASYDGHLSLSALWAQHNENRLLFPNLIVLALSRVTAFNVTVEEYLGAVLLFAAVALIIFAHRRRSPGRPWIVYCPVVILMLSVAQAGNTLWGFQLAWYLVLVALAAVIYLLDAKTLSAPGLLLGMLVAVIGSYSSLQGLFIWVVGLMILFYRKRSSLFFALWGGAAVLTTAVYFYHYDRSATVTASQTGLHVPGTATRFFFESVGDVLGVPLTQNDVGADLVLAFGVLIVALALWTLWSNGRRRDTESASPVGLALIVFGLLFALANTYGRGVHGAVGASALRYTTYDLLIVVGVYLSYLAKAPQTSRPKNPIMSRGVFGALLGGVIVVQALFGLVSGIRWARSEHQGLVTTAAVTVDVDRLPDPVVQNLLSIFDSAQVLREDVEVLSTHKLSFFSDEASVRYFRQQASVDSRHDFGYKAPSPTSIELPHRGSVLSGKAILAASVQSNLQPREVEFELSGPGVGTRLVGKGAHTTYGWLFSWRTSSVPNGSYQLNSVVIGSSGHVSRSAPVAINIRN